MRSTRKSVTWLQQHLVLFLLLANFLEPCLCLQTETDTQTEIKTETEAGNDPRKGESSEKLTEQSKALQEEEKSTEAQKQELAKQAALQNGNGALNNAMHGIPLGRTRPAKQSLPDKASFWSWLGWSDPAFEVSRKTDPPRMWGQQCGQTLYASSSMEGYGGPGLLAWEPPPERYFLLYCNHGKISRRIKCLLNHLLYAGLLQRTLLIPTDPSEVEGRYNYETVFDLEHFRNCYGTDTVMTTTEYVKKHGENVTVDQLFCWTTRDGACPLRKGVDENDAQNRYLEKQDFGRTVRFWKTVQMGPTVKLHLADLGRQVLLEEFFSRFRAAQGKVLLLGDMFFTSISHLPELYTRGDIPFFRSETCPNSLAVQPHKAIFLAAQNFIKQFLKDDFLAVHMRRADFVSDCEMGTDCTFPVPQLAECTRDKMAETNLSTIYLATDGDATDVRTFQEVAHEVNGREIQIVRFPPDVNLRGWASPLVKSKLATKSPQTRIDPLVVATIEKVVCAYSAVFLGSSGSAFSTDVERLRYGLGTATCEDRVLCDADPAWAKNDFRLQPFSDENRDN